jgi:1-deoxy-D-xylulose-5-phosphate reductoisomerase
MQYLGLRLFKMKNICLLGSTGSIGANTLKVIERFKERFNVLGLASGGRNLELLMSQIKKWNPKVVSVPDQEKAKILLNMGADKYTRLIWGDDGLKKLVVLKDAHMIVMAMSGSQALIPTLEAVRAGKIIALANKEAIVMAGRIIVEESRKSKAIILPVDSEANAVFQCLSGNKIEDINRIILTASGGPFYDLSKKQLSEVTPEDALRHPNWDMGEKISIDSATLLNKGLEIIELHHLFNVDIEKIEVVVHPQSLVHSMVEFADGVILSQMSITDMCVPIQNVLSYPERWKNKAHIFNLDSLENLNFYPVDMDKFPCLACAYEAAKTGGTMPAALIVSGEVAVNSFLKRKIKFYDISDICREIINKHTVIKKPDLNDILDTEKWARREAEALVVRLSG